MKRYLLLLSLSILSLSCVKDVDTEQIESAVFTTPLSMALLQIELTQDDFLDANNNEISSYFQPNIIDLSGLFYESTSDSLVFSTQFSSTFNRDIYCQFSFYNELNTLLMTSDQYLIESLNSPVVYSTTYEGADYDLFISARRIDVRISLRDGSPIQANENANFSMQSVIHFDFILQP